MVKLIRFNNGMDIIAKVSDSNPARGKIEITSPIRVVMMPPQRQGDNPSIGLAPWCEYSKSDTFEVSENSILFITDPMDELKNQYITIVSGIITNAQPGLILPS